MGQQEFILTLLSELHQAKQDVPQNPTSPTTSNRVPFTFVDLFAGIGGFRIALERHGGKCVFSSEWDENSQKTYTAWFKETPAGDITKIDPRSIPKHDVLAAGFPCQPFSIAGVSKKKSLGRPHGFDDLAQGNLFFNLETIIRVKRPPILFLENVKNLRSHDSGQTWKIIRKHLEALRYWVFAEVIDAASWVPQHRERIYIVCFDKDVFKEAPPFSYPKSPQVNKPILKDILEKSPDEKYTLTSKLWTYLQKYAEKHKSKGNGFGFSLASFEGVTRTLSARYYKDGSEILIPQKASKSPRRLTPRECARLMGFPDNLPIVVSDTQAYRQFGNAVVPKVVDAIFEQVLHVISWHISLKHGGHLFRN